MATAAIQANSNTAINSTPPWQAIAEVRVELASTVTRTKGWTSGSRAIDTHVLGLAGANARSCVANSMVAASVRTEGDSARFGSVTNLALAHSSNTDTLATAVIEALLGFTIRTSPAIIARAS